MAAFYVTTAMIHFWHYFTLLPTHVKSPLEYLLALLIYEEILHISEIEHYNEGSVSHR